MTSTPPTTPPSSSLRALDPAQEEIFGARLQPAACEACGAAFLLPLPSADARPQAVCVLCGEAALAVQALHIPSASPELIVPPVISREAAAKILRAHGREIWLPVPGLTAAEAAGLRLVWWPMWLCDAQVNGRFSAEAGYEYTVQSSQEHFSGGTWTTVEEQDTKVRWEPRAGQIRYRLHNIAVAALSQHATLLLRASLCDQAAARPPTAADLEGALLLLPDLPPDAAWPSAQEAFHARAMSLCQVACSADAIRDMTFSAEYHDLHWTWLLQPMWVATHEAEGRLWLRVVNGQTGRVWGPRQVHLRRLAWITAALEGLWLALASAGVLAGLLGVTLLPPLILAAVLLLSVAALLGVATLIPAFWAMTWNRRQAAMQPPAQPGAGQHSRMRAAPGPK